MQRKVIWWRLFLIPESCYLNLSSLDLINWTSKFTVDGCQHCNQGRRFASFLCILLTGAPHPTLDILIKPLSITVPHELKMQCFLLQTYPVELPSRAEPCRPFLSSGNLSPSAFWTSSVSAPLPHLINTLSFLYSLVFANSHLPSLIL